MKKLALVACLTLGLASHAAAQSPLGAAFEVASVKPGNPDATGPLGAMGSPTIPPTIPPPVGGRFTASNVPLRFLVGIAYDLNDFQIVGGPDWQMSRRFDIQAKAAAPDVGMDAMLPMIKALLADRFHLKVHTELREMPIYALVIARDDRRLGANITRSTADCSNAQAQKVAETMAREGPTALAGLLHSGRGLPCTIMPVPTRGVAGAMTMRANGQSMAALAKFLTSTTGRIVRDRTGLSGLYDWELTFDRAVRPRAAPQTGNNLPIPPTLPPSDSPELTTALHEQLGLKLQSTRGPVEVLVIDSAALPEPD